MSRCYCLSSRTGEITSLHQIYQCDGSVVLHNSSTVGNFKLFSLTTLPLHCCIYRRDVTDLIFYPRNITSRADKYLVILLQVR